MIHQPIRELPLEMISSRSALGVWIRGFTSQYIGISCDTRWWKWGPRRDSLRRRFTNMTLSTTKRCLAWGPRLANEHNRVLKIKGWYDEEHLAISKDPNDNTHLIPSIIMGTACPRPMLNRLNAESDFAARWIPAAYLSWIRNLDPTRENSTLSKGLNRFYFVSWWLRRLQGSSNSHTSALLPRQR